MRTVIGIFTGMVGGYVGGAFFVFVTWFLFAAKGVHAPPLILYLITPLFMGFLSGFVAFLYDAFKGSKINLLEGVLFVAACSVVYVLGAIFDAPNIGISEANLGYVALGGLACACGAAITQIPSALRS